MLNSNINTHSVINGVCLISLDSVTAALYIKVKHKPYKVLRLIRRATDIFLLRNKTFSHFIKLFVRKKFIILNTLAVTVACHSNRDRRGCLIIHSLHKNITALEIRHCFVIIKSENGKILVGTLAVPCYAKHIVGQLNCHIIKFFNLYFTARRTANNGSTSNKCRTNKCGKKSFYIFSCHTKSLRKAEYSVNKSIYINYYT